MAYDLDVAAEKMAELAPRPEYAQAAMGSLREWLEFERFAEYRPLLVAMLEAGAWDTPLSYTHLTLPTI